MSNHDGKERIEDTNLLNMRKVVLGMILTVVGLSILVSAINSALRMADSYNCDLIALLSFNCRMVGFSIGYYFSLIPGSVLFLLGVSLSWIEVRNSFKERYGL